MPTKRRILRELGRALVIGTADQIVDALDEAIEPKGVMFERVSDVVIRWMAEPIVEGRAEIIAGIRDALEQVDG